RRILMTRCCQVVQIAVQRSIILKADESPLSSLDNPNNILHYLVAGDLLRARGRAAAVWHGGSGGFQQYAPAHSRIVIFFANRAAGKANVAFRADTVVQSRPRWGRCIFRP